MKYQQINLTEMKKIKLTIVVIATLIVSCNLPHKKPWIIIYKKTDCADCKNGYAWYSYETSNGLTEGFRDRSDLYYIGDTIK